MRDSIDNDSRKTRKSSRTWRPEPHRDIWNREGPDNCSTEALTLQVSASVPSSLSIGTALIGHSRAIAFYLAFDTARGDMHAVLPRCDVARLESTCRCYRVAIGRADRYRCQRLSLYRRIMFDAAQRCRNDLMKEEGTTVIGAELVCRKSQCVEAPTATSDGRERRSCHLCCNRYAPRTWLSCFQFTCLL